MTIVKLETRNTAQRGTLVHIVSIKSGKTLGVSLTVAGAMQTCRIFKYRVKVSS